VPRGPVSPTDAALIAAAAERGVTVSQYQLERWRTAGYLERNLRRWRGRGKGSVATPPAGAVDRIVLLAGLPPRRRRQLPLGQPLVEFADGLPVPEARVRQALFDELTRWSRKLGASAQPRPAVGDSDDDQWQAGWDAADAFVRREGRQLAAPPTLTNWVALAFDVEADIPDHAMSRQSALSMVQLITQFDDVDVHDLLDAIADLAGLPSDQRDQMHAAAVQEQLAGESTMVDELRLLGLGRLWELAEAAPLETIRDVFATLRRIWMYHGLILVGLLTVMPQQLPDAAPLPTDLQVIVAGVVRCVAEIESDPMWAIWGGHPPLTADQINAGLTLTGLALLGLPRTVVDLEAYRDRLASLLDPIEAELSNLKNRL
jgi:hypothetical protein